MLTLRTRGLWASEAAQALGRRVVRISTDPNRPEPLRRDELYLSGEGSLPRGYLAYAHFSEASNADQSLPIVQLRSEEHTSELQSLKRHSHAAFCLTKKKQH